jgi:hypothetical protein
MIEQDSARADTLVRAVVLAVALWLPPTGVVTVEILAINDFHGNLEPPSGSNGGSTVRAVGLDFVLRLRPEAGRDHGQCETQRTWFKSAETGRCRVANVTGVWPS